MGSNAYKEVIRITYYYYCIPRDSHCILVLSIVFMLTTNKSGFLQCFDSALWSNMNYCSDNVEKLVFWANQPNLRNSGKTGWLHNNWQALASCSTQQSSHSKPVTSKLFIGSALHIKS